MTRGTRLIESALEVARETLSETQEASIVGMVREDRVPYGRADSSAGLAAELKSRTFQIAVQTVNLLDKVYDSPSIRVIRYQLLKSVTSVGANYRAVCQARSNREFFSKMSVVVEEADETMYWFELLEATDIKIDKDKVRTLLAESTRLTNFFSKSRSTIKDRLKKEKKAAAKTKPSRGS